MDATELQNRLLLATSTWREMLDDPLPRMAAGDPGSQIEAFELELVDRLCRDATRDSARVVADRTWELVHARPDSDPVKRRVIDCHDELVRLTTEQS